MTQPTALFLADILESRNGNPTGFGLGPVCDKAAAELRRLHAENEALRKTLAASCDEERQQMWEAGPGGGCLRALSAESQRDALLAACRMALMLRHLGGMLPGSREIVEEIVKAASAAIAKAEEDLA